jgi:hypothetical protein
MPSREASLRNLEEARANWRRPRLWRSHAERRQIRMFAWQWLLGHGPWCSGRALAEWLGVSHTYIQKLSRTLPRDENEFLHHVRCYGGVPSTGALRSARESSRREREQGLLRTQPRFKGVEIRVGSNLVRTLEPTKPNAATRVAQNPFLPSAPKSPNRTRGLDYTAIHMWNLRIAAASTYEGHPGRVGRRWRPGMRPPRS